MRWALAVLVVAGCGRVDFEARGDAALDSLGDAADRERLIWLAFDDDPSDGADNRGVASTTASCEGACPTLGTGMLGGGYVFDGTSTLRVARAPELELARGTVMLWIRADQPLAPGEVQTLAAAPFGPTNADSWELYLSRNMTDPVEFSSGSDVNGNHYLRMPWTVATGAWVHVAMTWSAGGMQRLVVDGTTRLTGTSFAPAYDSHDVFVGGDEDSGAVANRWRGAIDDLVIVGRELSDAEIRAVSMGLPL